MNDHKVPGVDGDSKEPRAQSGVQPWYTTRESPMRALFSSLALASMLGLSACGGAPEERTVVVNPQPSQTVVVPPEGSVRRCPAGQTVC
jgi:hypothetical protein